MNIPPGELADRYSILVLKRQRLEPNEDVEREFHAVLDAVTQEQIPNSELSKLFSVNGQIWDLEAEIRQGKEGTLTVSTQVKGALHAELMQLAEIGRRALMIRNLNGTRVQYKNEINARLGGFIEVKGKHASA